jgi:helicase
MEYKQIAGRAGRPRFDKEGIAVVEARSQSEVKIFIREYLRGEIENVHGYLNLADFVLSYVTREIYATVEQIKRAMGFTLSLSGKTEKDVQDVVNVLKEHGLVHVDETGGVSSTALGRNISHAYVNVSDALYFLSFVEENEIEMVKIVANSPKTTQVARGAQVTPIVQGWIKGKSEKELTLYGQNLTEKDVKQIVETASWQAFTFYRILDALNHRERVKALKLWQSIQYGVPANAINLVKLQGIGRKTALKLYELGYTTKKEICENLDEITPKLEGQLEWRVTQLCKKQAS